MLKDIVVHLRVDRLAEPVIDCAIARADWVRRLGQPIF